MLIVEKTSQYVRVRIANRFSSSLAQNTLWALGGYGVRLVIQAAYFIVIVRYLGPGRYGGFVAATALTNLIAPFVGMGSGNLLVKNVARRKSLFPQCWGNGLAITLLSGVGLVGFVILASIAVLPRSIPVFVILCISVSDLVAVKFVELAAFAFQAFEMLSENAHLNVLISLTRLVGIVALALLIPHPNLRAWSIVYLGGSVFAGLIAVLWATVRLGRPQLKLSRIRGESVEGFTFSTGLSAQTIYNDIDKTMLARLGTLEATGVYSAAYRIIDVAFVPVRALLNAAYPGFFSHGMEGIRGTIRYGRRLLLRVLPYSVLVSLALLLGAPIVSLILGPRYAQVTEALRWLSILPLLKTLHYFAADALTGAGYQGTRTAVQIGIAIFNVLFNLWIIPAYGWRGAAWSSIASDGLLAVTLWLIAIRLSAKAHDRYNESGIAVTETAQL